MSLYFLVDSSPSGCHALNPMKGEERGCQNRGVIIEVVNYWIIRLESQRRKWNKRIGTASPQFESLLQSTLIART